MAGKITPSDHIRTRRGKRAPIYRPTKLDDLFETKAKLGRTTKALAKKTHSESRLGDSEFKLPRVIAISLAHNPVNDTIINALP